MSRPPSPWTFNRPDRLARLAPLPFVAVSAILVALLVFTPVLLSSGTSIYLAQGELYVDRLATAGWTRFYLQPFDPQQVRYTNASIDLGSGFAWNGTCPTNVPSWSNTSESDTRGIQANATANPVVVYASAVYTASDGSVTIFAGMFALDVAGYPGPSPTMALVACPRATPGVAVASSPVGISDTNFPIVLTLVDFGSGGPP